jgi:hypothetical protein
MAVSSPACDTLPPSYTRCRPGAYPFSLIVFYQQRQTRHNVDDRSRTTRAAPRKPTGSVRVQNLHAVSLCCVARSETAVAKTLGGQAQKLPGFWVQPEQGRPCPNSTSAGRPPTLYRPAAEATLSADGRGERGKQPRAHPPTGRREPSQSPLEQKVELQTMRSGV